MSESALKGGILLYLTSLAIAASSAFYIMIFSKVFGVGYIGILSEFLSSSTLAVLLVTSGIKYAILRESSYYKSSIFSEVLISLIIFSVLSSLLSSLFTNILLNNILIVVSSSFFSFFSASSIILEAYLCGLAKFKEIAISHTLSSFLKLAVAIFLLVFTRYHLIALLSGYLSYSLFTFILMLYFSLREKSERIYVLSISTYRFIRILKLSIANFPYALSEMLLRSLYIYLFSYINRSLIAIGKLYIITLVFVVLSDLPVSIMNATFPINTGQKTTKDVMEEVYKTCAGLSSILFIMFFYNTNFVLGYLFSIRGFITYLSAQIVIYSLFPYITLYYLMIMYNRFYLVKNLSLLGSVRLSILVALVLLFAKPLGLLGAALAFLLSNFFSITYAYISNGSKNINIFRYMAINLCIASSLSWPFLLIIKNAPLLSHIIFVTNIIILIFILNKLNIVSIDQFILLIKSLLKKS